jgi:hypothetical protein
MQAQRPKGKAYKHGVRQPSDISSYFLFLSFYLLFACLLMFSLLSVLQGTSEDEPNCLVHLLSFYPGISVLNSCCSRTREACHRSAGITGRGR